MGKKSVLSSIGYLPKPPTNLSVKHFSKSCNIDWTFEFECPEIPITGFKIQFCVCGETEVWKDVCEKIGSKPSFTVTPLKRDINMKFRVFARNENGFSEPTSESNYQKTIVLPNQPECPAALLLTDGTMVVDWEGPHDTDKDLVTMYKVEGKTSEQEWKLMIKISAEFEKKLEIENCQKFGFKEVRVIALNNDGESEPSIGCVV